MATFVNFILFQVAWFACVLGSARGFPWIGPVVVAGVAAYHLSRVPNLKAEFSLLALAAGIGAAFDSALAATGWLSYPSGQWHPLLAPYWIVALWVAFATTLNVSLNWLKGRLWLALAFGAVGGPLAYLAGAKLGGVAFHEPALALTALAFGWASITPTLVLIAIHLDGWRPEAHTLEVAAHPSEIRT
jgi:hypothetical protein